MNKPLPHNRLDGSSSGPSDALQRAMQQQRNTLQQGAMTNQSPPVHPNASPPPVRPNPQPSPASSSLDFLSGDRRENEYEEAVRHSKKVKFWKIALPSIGGLVVLGIAGSLLINSIFSPELGIDAISLDGTSLIMENPQLSGIDEKNRTYSLTADQAKQDASNPTRVELSAINAELPIDDKTSAKIKAGLGIYDAELKTLILEEKIYVETTNGLKLNLDDAQIDIDKGSLNTSGNVQATSPQADISADSISVEERGNIVKFSGNVRMTLRPKELQELDTQ